jgi:PiT family inorganic phosphate transporter
MIWIIIVTILVAFVFDFVNGMNDAANSIATIVSTKILSPSNAVIWAAFFNFVALFIYGTHVAKTLGSGIVTLENNFVDVYLIFSALMGAIIWAYFFCARFGIPVSSSHSLIGGLIGAALVKGGHQALILGPHFFSTKIFTILLFILVAPVLGMVLGYFIMVVTIWCCRKMSPARVDRFFRVGQLVSSASFSLGHGGNDAQKTMGIIAMLLYSSRNQPLIHDYLYQYTDFRVPIWVIFSAHFMIAMGTLAGGWKIVKTMGSKITHLKPVGGFAAETAGAATLYWATMAGIPVSTTQTIAGAIMGVGTTRGLSAVKWGLAGNIIATWLLTIPCSAILSALVYFILSQFMGYLPA